MAAAVAGQLAHSHPPAPLCVCVTVPHSCHSPPLRTLGGHFGSGRSRVVGPRHRSPPPLTVPSRWTLRQPTPPCNLGDHWAQQGSWPTRPTALSISRCRTLCGPFGSQPPPRTLGGHFGSSSSRVVGPRPRSLRVVVHGVNLAPFGGFKGHFELIWRQQRAVE